MSAICISNNLNSVSNNKVQQFAFMQDENGEVPLSIGRRYAVYGLKENIFGKFILVVRDEERLPWWMPAELFSRIPSQPAPTWKTEKFPGNYGGEVTMSAPTIYFEHEEAIEDGEPEGYKAFSQMQKEAI